MNYWKHLHEVLDGAQAGDPVEVAIALALLGAALVVSWLSALVVSWLSAKASAFAGRQGWRLFKWTITPKPLGELAQFLLSVLNEWETRLVGDTDIRCGERICFWCPGGSDRFTEIRFATHDSSTPAPPRKEEDVLPLLTRRERRRVLKTARWRRACLKQEHERREREQEWARRQQIVEKVLAASAPQPKDVTRPAAWGVPQPCRCAPETGEVCNTCTGHDMGGPQEVAPSVSAQRGSSGKPLLGDFAGCNCAACRQQRDTQVKHS